jgi:hypothetical protein
VCKRWDTSQITFGETENHRRDATGSVTWGAMSVADPARGDGDARFGWYP